MADRFSKQASTLISPVTDGFVITPADVTVFTQPTRQIYVGNGGTLTVELAGKVANTTLSFLNVANGATLYIRAQKVFANTTANNILGLY